MEELTRVDNLLQEIGEASIEFLRAEGYQASPRTTPGIENPDTLMNKLPQKTVATRAGLGWIGKCALLITPEFGSAVRLGSVLTDAGFNADVAINLSQCQDCTACIEVCPAAAIIGEEWSPGTDRNALVDAFSCRRIARELLIKRTGGEIVGRTLCGMCIAACPWTRKYLERAR
jgi:epoxyqueuosine reductase QueG